MLGLSRGEEDGTVTAQPAIDALPVWAQIFITILVGCATLGIALKGYLTKDRPATADTPQTTAILAATIADMGAIRNLSDCVIRLDASVVRLTEAIDEHTHHERNSIELDRELCARLRELREVIERKP